MKQAIQYLGYGLFSEFLKALDFIAPVECTLVTHEEPGRHGLTACRSVIVTTQVHQNEVIYHRFTTASYFKMGATLMDTDHHERAQKAFELTEALLTGHTVRHASLAMPKNLTFTEGHNDLLTYVKDGDTFVLKLGNKIFALPLVGDKG